MKKGFSKGFTLIEMLIVVAIIGIVSGTSIVTFQKLKTKQSAYSDMETIKSLLSEARSMALYHGEKDPAYEDVKVEFSNLNGGCKVEIFKDATSVKKLKLAPNTKIKDITDILPGQDNFQIIFTADSSTNKTGQVSNSDGNVTFTVYNSSSSEGFKMTVDQLTGIVNVESGTI